MRKQKFLRKPNPQPTLYWSCFFTPEVVKKLHYMLHCNGVKGGPKGMFPEALIEVPCTQLKGENPASTMYAKPLDLLHDKKNTFLRPK